MKPVVESLAQVAGKARNGKKHHMGKFNTLRERYYQDINERHEAQQLKHIFRTIGGQT